MRRKKTQSIKEVLGELIDDYQLGERLNEVNLIDLWPQVAGSIINSYTTNLYIRDKCLYVRLSSSTLRGELMMYRTSIIRALNEKIGKEIITNLILQ